MPAIDHIVQSSRERGLWGNKAYAQHTIHLYSPDIIITVWETWKSSATPRSANKKLEILVGAKGNWWAEAMQTSSWGAEKCSRNKSLKKKKKKENNREQRNTIFLSLRRKTTIKVCMKEHCRVCNCPIFLQHVAPNCLIIKSCYSTDHKKTIMYYASGKIIDRKGSYWVYFGPVTVITDFK